MYTIGKMPFKAEIKNLSKILFNIEKVDKVIKNSYGNIKKKLMIF